MQKNYCYDDSTHTKGLSGPEKQRNSLRATAYDSIEAQCSFWCFKLYEYQYLYASLNMPKISPVSSLNCHDVCIK